MSAHASVAAVVTSEARTFLADVLLLTLLVAIVLAWPIAAPPIGAHGEAREGLVVQNIVHEGRWVLPLRNGQVPSKPPLFHWIAAATASMVGLSDAVVRFPSALAAWLVVLLTYALGVAAGGRPVGWLAVGALAGMHTFFESASEARVDMLFVACVTLALAAFFEWYRRDEQSASGARAACYAAVAAAVLTKGPAGAVLPLLVMIVFLARERRLDRLRALWSWPLAAMVVLVDGGWYALATSAGGTGFLQRQIFHENLDRFVGRGVFGQHGGRSRLMMVENLATDLLPWNLVLPWAAVRWWRGEREDTIGRFLHTWWLVIVAFFTIAYGKRGVYLLPIYPAIAVLAGRALGGVLARLRAEPRGGALAALVPERWWPERPARVLVAAVLAIDLGVILVGQIARVRHARRASLVPFAHAVTTRVAPDASLVADDSLDESDFLVLTYRLDRAVSRAAKGAPCVPGRYRLVTPRPGAPVVDPLLTAERRGVPVMLMQDTPERCALALGSEHDR
jgi:4-amino-4-deoxy-L-arabinose transferase-like glycosyltransferase